MLVCLRTVSYVGEHSAISDWPAEPEARLLEFRIVYQPHRLEFDKASLDMVSDRVACRGVPQPCGDAGVPS